jgi:hypothetical protein
MLHIYMIISDIVFVSMNISFFVIINSLLLLFFFLLYSIYFCFVIYDIQIIRRGKNQNVKK